jgi:hypothetical protein
VALIYSGSGWLFGPVSLVWLMKVQMAEAIFAWCACLLDVLQGFSQARVLEVHL